MFTLKLDEIPEEGLDLEWSEERTSLMTYLETLSRIDFDFDAPLHCQVRTKRTGPSVMITGSVRTTLRLQCVRCLKEFSYPLSSTFELVLHPLKEFSFKEEAELGSEEMEVSFFEGGELHLSEVACEQVFLEIPYQPLCQEACKGLCPLCGRDLNLSRCDCIKEEFTSAFSVLKK